MQKEKEAPSYESFEEKSQEMMVLADQKQLLDNKEKKRFVMKAMARWIDERTHTGFFDAFDRPFIYSGLLTLDWLLESIYLKWRAAHPKAAGKVEEIVEEATGVEISDFVDGLAEDKKKLKRMKREG